jgi:hypothetical protein
MTGKEAGEILRIIQAVALVTVLSQENQIELQLLDLIE